MTMAREYDIESAFAAIEDELIDSMMRNMKRHRVEEVAEDKQWEMWQALQLKALEEYKKKNKKKFASLYSDINGQIEDVIREAQETYMRLTFQRLAECGQRHVQRRCLSS